MDRLKKNIALFSITNFFQVAVFIAAMVNYPQFLTHECGFGEAFAGTLVGLLAISNLIAIFPLGLISDRLSPKRIYQVSQVCLFVFFILLAFVKNRWIMVLLFVCGGIGFSASRIMLPVLYYKYLPQKRRSANVSVFLCIGYLGFSLGGFSGGLSQGYSVYYPFFIAAGMSLFLILWTFLLPDSKPEKIRVLEYVNDILNRKVLALILVFMLTGIHFGVEQYGFPKLIREGIGISSRNMGMLYLYIGLMLAGMAFIVKKLLGKYLKHFLYFGIGLIISGVFQWSIFLADDFSSLLMIRLAHVVGDAVVLLMSGVVVASIFPGARMGGNVGLVMLVSACGQFGGILLAGFFIDISDRLPSEGMFSGYAASFTLSGIIMILVGVWFILISKRLGVAEKPGVS